MWSGSGKRVVGFEDSAVSVFQYYKFITHMKTMPLSKGNIYIRGNSCTALNAGHN